MFQQFAFQRKSPQLGIRKTCDKTGDFDGKSAKTLMNGVDSESVVVIAETPDCSPVRTMDDNESLSDEELLKSTFEPTDNESKTLEQSSDKYFDQEHQESDSSLGYSKSVRKFDKRRKLHMGTEKQKTHPQEKDKFNNILNSNSRNSAEASDNVDIVLLQDIKNNSETFENGVQSRKKPKSKRKRVISFNDSDSDVCLTPQKKLKESTEIKILSCTNQDDNSISPRNCTDGRVDILNKMFPNRTDEDILGAIEATDNVAQAVLVLSNSCWTPKKDRSKNDKKDVQNGEALKPQVIEILDDEDDDIDAADNVVGIDDDDDDDDDNDNEYECDVIDDCMDEDGFYSSEKETILSFLDTCSLDDLIRAFSEKKAQKLIQLRPFESWTDLKEKFGKFKGLSEKALHQCQSFLKKRTQIVQFMERCEKISKDIQTLLPGQLNGEITSGMTQPGILNPNCQLKPYQLTGLHWLKLMYCKNMNCILADEMGLGKTIQALSFIAHLIEQGNDGPYLIVAPTSTVENWIRELQLWCPNVEYIAYLGSIQERIYLRQEIKSEGCQVIITTYQTVCSTSDDKKFFSKRLEMSYVIFDEGHMLKNMQTIRYQKLFKINAKRRLLLTGTPLQNDLLELMSLLHFVMPHMFGGISEELKMLFADNKVENYAKERVYEAKNIMKPFVLRRLKKDVLSQLPNKTEEIVMLELTQRQRVLYDKVFKECKEEYINHQGTGVYTKTNSKIKNLMMPLRLTSNHPLLLRDNYSDSILHDMAVKYCRDISNRGSEVDLVYEDMTVMSDFELHHLSLEESNLTSYALDQDVLLDSGKFNYLAKTLPEMKEKGDRVLLFSQFQLVMDVIEVFLKHHKYRFLRLDGTTKIDERQNLIDQFNDEDDIFIFLLSTRAGGLGINLTSANVVIIHDIDFNPYNDKQAEDRSHRVGQTRDVLVYKLISQNTIEEAILKRAQSKLKLEKDVVSSNEIEEAENDEATILGQTFG